MIHSRTPAPEASRRPLASDDGEPKCIRSVRTPHVATRTRSGVCGYWIMLSRAFSVRQWQLTPAIDAAHPP